MIMIMWNVMSCILVERYWHFGHMHCHWADDKEEINKSYFIQQNTKCHIPYNSDIYI